MQQGESSSSSEQWAGAMDPALLLIMSSFLQLQQFVEPTSSFSSSTDPAPLIFFVLSCVLVHAAAIFSESGEEDWWGLSRHTIYKNLVNNHVGSLDPSIRDREWRKHFGLSHPLFTGLVDELTPLIKREAISMPIEAAVAMVLYRLCQGHNVRRLASEYRTEPWVITRVTNMVTRALSTKLYCKYVSIPSGPRLLEIIEGFKEATGLPNMCGAIDGSHVKIYKKPDEEYTPAHYKCRHYYFAILLQAVCDHRRIFWDVCVKAPGATEDAAHLRESSLFSKLMSGEILGGSIVTIRGNHIRPYIVGDCCYPLLSFLLTPFSADRSGTPSQNLFDTCLMKGRSSIEDALGLLKGRWRILQNLNVGLKHAPQTIVACCVLHNICQLAGEPEPPLFKDPDENGAVARPLDTEKSNHYFGESIRQVLLEDLQEKQHRQ